jgi:serine/threonine protein kinase/Flp pilus assembly protein TadD
MRRPTMSRTIINNDSRDDLEAIVEAFELELESAGEANLGDFLPAATTPGYLEVAVELIRVDLESARARGAAKRLEEYVTAVPSVFGNPQALGQIAFEEYRLRKQAGEPVDVSEYSRRFSIDTSDWPDWQRDANGGDSKRYPLSSAGRAGIGRLQFPQLGEQFAGFELIELLGRGAFGVVFRARQRDLARREVVLKITPARSVEPQRLARLQHTNIVPIYSVHQQAGLLGICMPFLGRHSLVDVRRERPQVDDQARLSTVAGRNSETVGGATLAIAAAQNDDGGQTRVEALPADLAPLGIAAATEVIAQLAEGLAHAHARGIVHSDLKPANVLIADDGTPLLMDFNLAGDSAATDYETLVVGGTLAYMSPEHLEATLDGRQAAAASDIYSLGVIFYELLTRQRLFPQHAGSFEQCAATMIRDRRRGAPSVQSLNPSVSPALAAIVAKCLAPDCQDRYARATELAEDLRRHQASLPLRFAAEPSLRERGGKWLRRNARGVRVATIVGLVAMLIAALALYAARRGRLLSLEADAAYAGFETDFVQASLSLNTPGNEPELYRIGREDANRAFARFGIDGARPDAKNALCWRLSGEQQTAVNEQAVKLQYALAGSAAERQRFFAQHDASSALGTYLHGVELLEKRESAAAMKVFEGLRQRDPQDATLWLLLGNAYYRGHRLADAEACYTAVIALEPRAYTGYFYRGECRMDQQHFAEAEMDFNSVLELKPGLPSGLMNRALVWRALGALDRAERDATSAIESGINDPRAFFVRALIREARGNVDGAKADRERGFELPPIDRQGWGARGIARLKDDPQKACDDFEDGLRAYPDTPALLENLIHVYGDVLNQQEQALAKADRLLELCPDEPSAWSTRAVLRARLGDRVGARQDATHAASDKIAPLTSLQLACAYALMSQEEPAAADEAIEQLQNALAHDPRLAARATTDADLAPIRSRSDFATLVAAANQLVQSTTPGSAPVDKASVGSGENR